MTSKRQRGFIADYLHALEGTAAELRPNIHDGDHLERSGRPGGIEYDTRMSSRADQNGLHVERAY